MDRDPLAYQLEEFELPKVDPRKITNFIKALGLDEILRMQSYLLSSALQEEHN